MAAPRNPFPHPYQPYPIQQALMQHVYAAVDGGKIAIVESPTGTGKTLSLICSVLHWLHEDRMNLHVSIMAEASSLSTSAADPSDWLLEFDAKVRRKEIDSAKEEVRKLRAALQCRIDAAREAVAALSFGLGGQTGTLSIGHKRRRAGFGSAGLAPAPFLSSPTAAAPGDDTAFLLPDDTEFPGAEDSETEGVAASMRAERSDGNFEGAAAVTAAAAGEAGEDRLQALLDAYVATPKVYFASRTHSQLAQFVGELRRTSLAPHLRLAVLGSRRTLCVNEAVRRLGSDARINERCAELQEQRAAGGKAATSATAAAAAGPAAASASAIPAAAVTPHSSSARSNRHRGDNPMLPRTFVAAAAVTADDAGTATGAAAGMVTARSVSRGGCPYLADAGVQATFRDALLGAPGGLDIEEAAALGSALHTCAYYGSRAAVRAADVVALPYALLLQAGTRESLGLDLTGAVVVVDEAHNLVDAINAAHSCVLSGAQLAGVLAALRAYLSRYAGRLSAANVVRCSQLAELLERLARMLRAAPAAPAAQAVVGAAAFSCNGGARAGGGSSSGGGGGGAGPIYTLGGFVHAARIDHLNIFGVLRHLAGSQLLRKLRGFVEAGLVDADAGGLVCPGFVAPASFGVGAAAATAAAATAFASGSGAATPGPPRSRSASTAVAISEGAAATGGSSGHGAAVAALHATHAFLTALSGADADCRIAVYSAPAAATPAEGVPAHPQPIFKFLSLNPAVHFRAVVDAARSIVLAGGTLAPVGDLVAQLFAHVPRPRLAPPFACGHVIPPTNLLALAVDAGPTGLALDFRHGTRAAPALMTELGRALVNIASAVPGGVVVFLPSYEYERALWAHWGGAAAVPPAAASAVATMPRTPGAGGASAGGGVSAAALGFSADAFPPDSILAALARRKRVFREPRTAGDMEAVLRAYAAACNAAPAAAATPVAASLAEAASAAADVTSLLVPLASRGTPSSATGSADRRTGERSSEPSPCAVRSADVSRRSEVSVVAAAPESADRRLQRLRSPIAMQQQHAERSGSSIQSAPLGAAAAAATAALWPALIPQALCRGDAAAAAAAVSWGALPQAQAAAAAAQQAVVLRARDALCPAPPQGAAVEAPRAPSFYVATTPGSAHATASGSAHTGGATAAAAAALSSGGGLLLAVVGGKLSEGINFSDRLARCCVMVGLPFPNAADPELRERMAYCDAQQKQLLLLQQQQQRERAAAAAVQLQSPLPASLPPAVWGTSQAASISGGGLSLEGSSGSGGAAATANTATAPTGAAAAAAPAAASGAVAVGVSGREYYENLCMRAVNQSIGRAIRHARDYATIVLLDGRFGTPRIRGKLPAWIAQRTVHCGGWGAVAVQLGGFFRQKRAEEEAAAAAATAAVCGGSAPPVCPS